MKIQKWSRRMPIRPGLYYMRAPNEQPALVEVASFRSMSIHDDPSELRLGVGAGGGQEPRWLNYYRERGCEWVRVPTAEELTGATS